MGEAKEAIADIAKETGGGKLATMLGFAGGTAAVTAFGAAVVETMKGGIEEAGKFQTQAFEMGYALNNMDLGTEMTEWAEKTASSVGTAEDRIHALQSLMQSGFKT